MKELLKNMLSKKILVSSAREYFFPLESLNYKSSSLRTINIYDTCVLYVQLRRLNIFESSSNDER